MAVSRTAIKEYLDRPFEDYRWMKQLSKASILRELSYLRVKPVFKTEPWLHQLVCFWIGLVEPRFLFLLDMGAGKTKILADLMTQLMRERRMRRALIGLPRLINIDSWEDDLALHSDLEPWRAEGSIEEKREALLNPRGDVTLIDYAGMHLALSKKEGKRRVRDDRLVKMAERLYDFIGLDEIHKLSALPGSKTGGRDNLWFSIMRQLTRHTPNVYGSTGTLFGRDPQNLWSPFYLVDRGETFGENVGILRAAFFDAVPNDFKGVHYVFDRHKAPVLNRMLQHRSLRYEEDELMDLPKRVPRLRVVDMTEEQREHYMSALEGLVNAGGEIHECKAQWLRMRQIISGYLAWKDGTGDHVIRFKKNPKLDWLESKVDEMGDSKVIICYDYTETGRMIVERIKSMGLEHVWYYGGTKDQSGERRRFMEDPKCRVMVMNSEAGGTGNDGLQKVARYMIFYESPCSPTTRKQTEKRIHRPGQKERSFIWDVVMQRSLDAGILANIADGIDVHERVVNGKTPSKKFFLTDVARR